MGSDAAITIELTHYRTPARAFMFLQGWIEGSSKDIASLFLGGTSVELSDLDPRLEGNIAIPRFSPGMTRSKFIVNRPVTVEGRPLNVGERVRITTGGGEIKWSGAPRSPYPLTNTELGHHPAGKPLYPATLLGATCMTRTINPALSAVLLSPISTWHLSIWPGSWRAA